MTTPRCRSTIGSARAWSALLPRAGRCRRSSSTASISAAWRICSSGQKRQRDLAFGAFIIGDEILVGKRQDKHLAFLIGALTKRGLRLAWAQYLGDDAARLTAALGRSFASGDVVFSFGGIGATPDDHTPHCPAAAAPPPLQLPPAAPPHRPPP